MPRVPAKGRRSSSLSECNGFKVDQDVIIYYNNGKHRVGSRGKISRIGKKKVVVTMDKDDSEWKGNWCPSIREYQSDRWTTMMPVTKSNEELVGDRSADSP